MKNLTPLIWPLILMGSMTMFGCYSNLDLYEFRYASKMKRFTEDTSATVKTGGVRMIPISTPKGVFQVWTKTIGNNQDIKVLLLGSGPGLSHEYLQCMESYFPGKAISMIYCDPPGSGNSDNPKDSALWDLSGSINEVEQLRLALNLNQDNFYLFGHGRCGMIALEYALKYQKNMKALILSKIHIFTFSHYTVCA